METRTEYQIKLVICQDHQHWYETVITLKEEEVDSQDMAHDVYEKAKAKWLKKDPNIVYAYIFLARINKVGEVPVPAGGLV